MGIEIRPATPSDIGGIRRVADRAWHAAHAPIIGADAVEEFLAEFYDAESFLSRIEDDASILDVVVEGEGEVIGFASATPSDGPSAAFDLERIYLHPDRWGEGIGRRLLDHVERKIGRRGGERIELGVMAENERAVNFYESAGFRREDEIYDDFVDTRSYIYVKDV